MCFVVYVICLLAVHRRNKRMYANHENWITGWYSPNDTFTHFVFVSICVPHIFKISNVQSSGKMLNWGCSFVSQFMSFHSSCQFIALKKKNHILIVCYVWHVCASPTTPYRPLHSTSRERIFTYVFSMLCNIVQLWPRRNCSVSNQVISIHSIHFPQRIHRLCWRHRDVTKKANVLIRFWLCQMYTSRSQAKRMAAIVNTELSYTGQINEREKSNRIE